MKILSFFSRQRRPRYDHRDDCDQTIGGVDAGGAVEKGACKADEAPIKFLLACFPKSGSTYLSSLIGNLPGFTVQSYVPAYEGREQELSEESILGCAAAPKQIAQHHVRASDYTLYLIQKHELRPIILVRNIFDAAVSVADHIHNEDRTSPMAFFDERLANLPVEGRVDAVIDLVIPWYFNFYTSWWSSMPDCFVTYEDIILGGFERQSSFLHEQGIEADPNGLQSALDRAKATVGLRFNIGRAGRGRELLTKDQVSRIKKLAAYYPDVDFQRIGLP